ncbi:hypothetical protein BLNAU_21716 [Blattamonas nauphoetae]|uniref:Protein kinase domain-containing protein n=1 Tax=Blattamonas nauphoetae TaxID=2049346 RepID=A0ABQ9WVK6_9EUKA|nr:hypothetical protein BLNAU_21716 [Blattamonas nauphoetae]
MEFLLLLARVSTCSNLPISPHHLSSVLNTHSEFSNSEEFGTLCLTLQEGTYIGDNVDIAHRWMELTGERWNENADSKTGVIGCLKTKVNSNAFDGSSQDFGSWIFSLTNSTLSLKRMDFSLITSSEAGRPDQNEAGLSRLAIVSNSMLTISESKIEISAWTSAIVISPSRLEESNPESSVMVQNCMIWNENGEFAGVVETSAFPSTELSVSVSIVGCSFDSARILGKDGIGLSLTRTARKREENVGGISSSLIGCSFVNMSSIGSSCQPQLSHLSQKMLGCVVSLTSSHLSGSTIRDVNMGGSVLCSNSSFSSVLSSPSSDTDEPTVTLPGGAPTPFDDSRLYYIEYGGETSSATFSHCHFNGSTFDGEDKLLTFNNYKGTINILSCSFTDFIYYRTGTSVCGGAVGINVKTPGCGPVTVRGTNFTNIWAGYYGCGMWVDTYGSATVVDCIFEECGPLGGWLHVAGLFVRTIDPSGTATLSNLVFESCCTVCDGGGMQVVVNGSAHISDCLFDNCTAIDFHYAYAGGLVLFLHGDTETIVTRLNFTDCESSERVSGMYVAACCDVVLSDLHFLRCTPYKQWVNNVRGGLSVSSHNEKRTVTVKDCSFVDCSSKNSFSAFEILDFSSCVIADCLVKDCSSAGSGAIVLNQTNDQPWSISLTRIAFINNSVGPSGETPESVNSGDDSAGFVDVYLNYVAGHRGPTLSIVDCFSTCGTKRIGMHATANRNTAEEWNTLVVDNAFVNVGPLLTESVVVSVDRESGRMELEMMVKIPIASQKYEVTIEDEGTKREMKSEIEFVNGKGTLRSPSPTLNLDFSTSYSITSIVGIVPSSSSSSSHSSSFSCLSNAMTFPLEAWAFNLAGTPSFTTPAQFILVGAKAHLVSTDQPHAFVILMLSEEVTGSFEIVVEEEGKDVVIEIEFDESSQMGESSNFVVVGEGRLLTHNTTYTIKSITPSRGTESPFVWMNATITFHIPESVFNPKKAMSPETKKLLSWLIPLIVSVCVALLVVIVILVVVKRRRLIGKDVESEMEEQEAVEVEKVEEFGVDCSGGVMGSEGMSHSAFDSSEKQGTEKEGGSEKKSGEVGGEYAEVMACSGDFGISGARMDSTLYSMLHKEHREIGKRMIGIQVVNGLKHVVAHRGWSDVLTRLSSHWILVDAEGQVRLKLEMSSNEVEAEAARQDGQKGQGLGMMGENENGNENEKGKGEDWNAQGKRVGDQSLMDSLRWRAPEVVSAEERSGVESVDGHKASVFSLGLVLWEIETGQVPFGELDAVNAQRQSGTGIGPKMDSLRNESFISLIRRCVSVDPKERPTLSEIGEFLSSHPEDTRVPSGIEMKV